MSDAEYVQPRQQLQGRIELAAYDPRWPALYAREEERLRAVLGDAVVRVEHAGSTSVPGLAAKPIVDIVLEVPDTRDEAAYAPALEAAGYVLTIREPGWFEHRLFKRLEATAAKPPSPGRKTGAASGGPWGPDTNINLHVFPRACSEVDRMLIFCDWLRTNEDDRRRYERAKRELAARDWTYVQDYADAKSEVVAEVMRRALVGAAARENAEWCALEGVGDGFRFSTTRTPQFYPDAVTLRPGVAVDDVLAAIDTSPGCSIKDSFDDLGPPGFRRLFRAQWLVGRRETLPASTGFERAIAHRSARVVGLSNVEPVSAWASAAAVACTVWGQGTVVGYEREVPAGAEAVGGLSVWTNEPA